MSNLPARRLPPSTPSYSDPRLRGLDLDPRSGFQPPTNRLLSPRERNRAAFDVSHADPYSEATKKEQEIGRRGPAQYDSSLALRGERLMPPDHYDPTYQYIGGEHAVNPAASVAGRRETMWGSTGADVAQMQPWAARDRFGYGQMQSRGGGGYSDQWDVRNDKERRSGKLTAVNRFSQRVDPRYPHLWLVAKGTAASGGNNYNGNARMLVSAGLSESGGATESREFFIGGGFTGSFDLNGWDQCTIEILALLPGTNVQFAWVTAALSAGNESGTLYLPTQIAVGAAGLSGVPVPEGAYAICIEDPNAAIGDTITVVWTTFGAGLGGGDVSFTTVVNDGSTGNNNQFGQPLSVLGTTIDIEGLAAGTVVDVVWFLRSI